MKSSDLLKFRDKPVTPIKYGHSFYFNTKDGVEYWINQKTTKDKKYSYQWITLQGEEIKQLHRIYINKHRLDVENETRDKNLTKTITSKANFKDEEVKDYLEELGLFISENINQLNKTPARAVDNKAQKDKKKSEEINDFKYLNHALDVIKTEDPLHEVTKYITRTVKHDEVLVKLSLLVMASAYTPNPLNLALEGPQSEGKTYALVEASKVFPKNDVWNLAGMTPEVLTREHGILLDKETGESLEPEIIELKQQINQLGQSKEDKPLKDKLKSELQEVYDRGEKVVNMEGKILLFLEAPKTQTLEKLRPIMSHDKYEIQYKFVDRPYQSGPLVTMDAKLKGWPVFLYATADNRHGNIWEQIRSRFIVVSPEMTQKKYKSANQFTANKHGTILDPGALEEDRLQFERCQGYILFIKKVLYGAFLQIQEVGTLSPDNVSLTYNPMAGKLEESFPSTQGQHMRDFKYFMSLMAVSCLFNFPNRPYLEARGLPYWMVTGYDLKNVIEVFDNYHFFIKGSELPIHYFKEIILNLDLTGESIDGDPGFNKKDIRTGFKQAGYPNSDNWININVLEPLEDLGLLNVGKDKKDNRANIYSPFNEKYLLLSSNDFLKINYTFKDLEKDFEKIKNILTIRSSIGITILNKGKYPLHFKKVVWGKLEGKDYDIGLNLKKIYSKHFSVSIFLNDGESSNIEYYPDNSRKIQFEDKSTFLKDKGERLDEINEEINKLQNDHLKGEPGANDKIGPLILEKEKLEKDEDNKNSSLKTYEELQVEGETLQYLNDNPNNSLFDIVSRKVTSKTGIDEPLVKEIMRDLIKGGVIKDSGDGNLEPVEGK